MVLGFPSFCGRRSGILHTRKKSKLEWVVYGSGGDRFCVSEDFRTAAFIGVENMMDGCENVMVIKCKLFKDWGCP